jgi:hypothetical protein
MRNQPFECIKLKITYKLPMYEHCDFYTYISVKRVKDRILQRHKRSAREEWEE